SAPGDGWDGHDADPVARPLARGVLRRHDPGQLQGLAVPDRAGAAVPVPAPQRLAGPLLRPELPGGVGAALHPERRRVQIRPPPARSCSPRILIPRGSGADSLLDFPRPPGLSFILSNTAKAPFPGGASPDPQTSAQVMKFVVGPSLSADNSVIPAVLPGPPA